MPRGILDTIANYEFQLRHGAARLRPGSDIGAQVNHFAEAAVRDSVLVTMTKQVLNGTGVPTIFYPSYYAFARKLNKRVNGPDGPRLAGDSAACEAAIHVSTWVARGLVQSVLERIVVSVLNISYPPKPESA